MITPGYGGLGGSGGGGGTNYWQLIGGGSDDIELNAGAGVTGIAAPLPADNRFNILLGEPAFSPGSNAAIHYFLDAVAEILLLSGVISEGGSAQALLSAINGAPGSTGLAQVNPGIDSDGNGIIGFDVNADSGPGASNVGCSIDGSGNGLFNFTVTDNAGNNYSIQINNMGAIFTYNTIKLFGILNSGQLQTNQAQAGAPAALLPTKKIPIYDNFGALQGYVPLFPS